MALIQCHECKKEVSTEAKQCPHCGAKVKRKPVAGAVVLILIVIAILGNIFNSKTHPAPTAVDACVASDTLVKKILKSPATAKFPDCNDQQITYMGANKWQVSSYVDSQNGFGALLRSNYTVVVEDKMDANETWVLVSSNFNEQ